MTSSVTGCSTWIGVFISMKYQEPSWSKRNSMVPALQYPIEPAPLAARAPIVRRCSSLRNGLGDSSISFW